MSESIEGVVRGYWVRVAPDAAQGGRVTLQGRLAPAKGGNTLAAMQEAVGGMIEHVYGFPSLRREGMVIDCWCDEEGLLKSLPRTVEVEMPGVNLVISGPVLVTATNEDGETIGLTKEEVADIRLVRWEDAGRFPTLQFRGEGSWVEELPDDAEVG